MNHQLQYTAEKLSLEIDKFMILYLTTAWDGESRPSEFMNSLVSFFHRACMAAFWTKTFLSQITICPTKLSNRITWTSLNTIRLQNGKPRPLLARSQSKSTWSRCSFASPQGEPKDKQFYLFWFYQSLIIEDCQVPSKRIRSDQEYENCSKSVCVLQPSAFPTLMKPKHFLQNTHH